MASRKRKDDPRRRREEEVEAFVREVRRRMKELRTDAVYVPFLNYGPFDHNPDDRPLPLAEFPEVFRPLYDAVEYVENSRYVRGFGPEARVKIMRIQEAPPGNPFPLVSDVVWRNWTPSY